MKKTFILLLTFFSLLSSSLSWAQTLIISEVADSGDNYLVRFVEIYNATDSSIDLSADNWYLSRQANGDSWADISLTGTVLSGETYVIAYNTTDFNSAYGYDPDLANGSISGNGDDGYFLYSGGDHTAGTLIDSYGEIDQDGTGESWEYEDSHAVRSSSICTANTTWTASEWTITGANVTDMTPNEHTCDCPSANDQDTEVDDTYTTQPVSATISSLDDTSTEANDVFIMDITDQGSGDTLLTKITNIRIKPYTTNTAVWSETIQGFTITDDNSNAITPTSVTITDTYVDFAFNTLDIADGNVTELTFAVYLNTSNIVDQSILSFMVDADDHGFTADSSGSGFATTFSGGDFNSEDFTIEVEATELRFIQQPTDVEVQSIMNLAVTVETTDANGNREMGLETATITLTTTGSFDDSATTVSLIDATGIATFNNLVFDQDANITITATDTDDYVNSETVTSNTFDVTPLQPCTNLFISEYAHNTSPSKHYLEIYNPTGVTIDMSNFQIWVGTDGGAWSSATVIQLGGTGVAASDYLISANTYVVAKANTEIPIANKFDSSLNFDGDDNIGLAWNGGSGTTYHLIDVIGDETGDPGTGWTVAGTTDATLDGSIIRSPAVTMGNTNWTASAGTDDTDSEWSVQIYNPQTQYFHVSGCQQVPLMGVVDANAALVFDESLTGPLPLLQPNAINSTLFADQQVETGQGETHSFYIINAGLVDLELDGAPLVEISGANASDFTVTLQPSATVDAAGTSGPGNSPFAINFKPTEGGVRTATVTISSSNSIFVPLDYTFTIQGTGLLNYTPCDMTTSTNTTIYLQDFEQSGGYTTSETEFTDGDKDYFTRSDGTNHTETYNDPINSYYFAAQDLDGEGSVTFPLTLTIEDIDIQYASNLILKVYLAEDLGLGWDDDDYVNINYDIDGNGYQNGIWVRNDGSEFNTRAQIDTDYNGVGNGTELTDTFTQFSKTITETGNLMNIKIEFSLNSGDEDIAIDHIEIVGDVNIPVSTTWYNNSGTLEWSNGVPTSTTKAIFDADYNTSTASIDACACQVNSDKTVTVEGSNYLLIETDIENNGTIEVLNEGSIVQHKNDAVLSGSGNYLIHKTTPTYAYYDYTYWSSPVTNETIGSVFAANPTGRIYDFITENFSDEYSGAYPQTATGADSFDDNGDAWNVTDPAEVLSAGKGYIAMGEGSPFPFDSSATSTTTTQSVVFDGGTLNNGIISVDVSLDSYNENGGSGSDDANTNVNLIGNPYASAIDIVKLKTYYTNNLFEGTFYFWTHDDPISDTNAGPDAYNFNNDDYSTVIVDADGNFSAVASSNADGTGGVAASQYVASGQGFFANVTDRGTIQFSNDMRVTNENTHFLRPANNIDRVWLNLRNQNHTIFRQILVGFHSGATDTFVNGQDGARMVNGNNTDFYSLIPNDTRRFAIQNLAPFNDSKTIALGLEIIEDGIYEIAIDHSEGIFANGQAVFIKDNLDNSYHEITNNIYQFSATIGDNINNRFELVFNSSALGVDNNTVSTDIIVSQKGGFINLNTSDASGIKSASIYNMLGQVLGNYQATGSNLQIPATNIASGTILIIKTTLDNGSVISKKVIKL